MAYRSTQVTRDFVRNSGGMCYGPYYYEYEIGANGVVSVTAGRAPTRHFCSDTAAAAQGFHPDRNVNVDVLAFTEYLRQNVYLDYVDFMWADNAERRRYGVPEQPIKTREEFDRNP